MSQETIERTFNVSLPARLVLSNIRGSVVIAPGNDLEVHVSAVKDNDSGDAARTMITIEQDADGMVRAETRYHHEGSFLFGDRPCKVDYMVSIPKQCSVDCKGISNRAFIRGLEGDFSISTISGDVQLNGLAGTIRLNAVSGQVSGESISGTMDYKTVSGNLHLVESQLHSVKGSSVSAKVWLQTALMEGPYQFDAVSGSLYFLVPPGTACVVESNAMSGALITDLPISRDLRRAGYRRAEIGNWGPLVKFKGVSGNVLILSGEAGKSAAGETNQSSPATVQETPLDASQVLDKIERGEISVDEGIALLKNKCEVQ
jgi:hypothetical protein